MEVLVNHLGYGCDDYKKAVLQGAENAAAGAFRVKEARSGRVCYQGMAEESGPVANWQTGYYWTMDFSELRERGCYRVEVDTSDGVQVSFPFDIEPDLISLRLLSGVGYYFKAQRSTGEWRAQDKKLRFAGSREGVVDGHGSWFDASGDYGIHMSHLSHSTYHNPQQAAFSAYVFFRVHELLEQSRNEQYTMIKRRMLDEGMYGTDFIMRMRAPSGSFFRSIIRGDALESVDESRKINFEYRRSSSQFGEAETAGEEVITDYHYETSFRSGGGYCIAALAAAGQYYYPGTDYTQAEYIQAAKDAYRYLEANNELYTNDGKWNLVDEYCALDALVELHKATREYDYLRKARAMAARMLSRLVRQEDGTAYFTVDEGRPFYHASDEGLPIVSLLNYCSIEVDEHLRKETLAQCEMAMRHCLNVTEAVNNPFGYGRYLLKEPDGAYKTRFFFSHQSAASPWWQGDNARIASLSCAAQYMADHTADRKLEERLRRFAEDQLNWIMGLNPYDSCMIDAFGRNNIQYSFNGRYDFLSCPGGICNGVTSGLEDEDSIAFIMEPTDDVTDNWRWAEQWIPHASWFLYAMAMKKR